MLGGSLTQFRTDEADQEGAGVLKDMFKAGWKEQEGILRAHASMWASEYKGNVLPWIVYIIGHYLWPNFSLRVKRILGFIRGIRSLESLPILCDNSGRILLRCAIHQLRYLLCVTLHEDNMATECCREPEYLSVG